MGRSYQNVNWTWWWKWKLPHRPCRKSNPGHPHLTVSATRLVDSFQGDTSRVFLNIEFLCYFISNPRTLQNALWNKVITHRESGMNACQSSLSLGVCCSWPPIFSLSEGMEKDRFPYLNIWPTPNYFQFQPYWQYTRENPQHIAKQFKPIPVAAHRLGTVRTLVSRVRIHSQDLHGDS
jgi:hypothetical protein